MFAEVNGVKLFFDIEGKEYVPDGPVLRRRPVCFVLHGGPGGDHTQFLPACSPLTDSMQLIYVDHRACGRSGPAPLETCTLEQNADDVEALRQYLGLDKVFVFGHSYGGMVAQQYALKYQEHLYGAVFSSTAPSYRFAETLPIEMEKRATDEMKREMEIMLNKEPLTEEDCKHYMMVLDPLYHYHYDKKESEEGAARSTWSPEVFRFGNNGGLSTFDFVPDLPKLRIPVLVLAGEEDFITPPVHAREIAEAVPGAELMVIPEAAHETYSDQPEKMLGALREFILKNFEA